MGDLAGLYIVTIGRLLVGVQIQDNSIKLKLQSLKCLVRELFIQFIRNLSKFSKCIETGNFEVSFPALYKLGFELTACSVGEIA